MNRSLITAILLVFTASLVHIGFFQSVLQTPLVHLPIAIMLLYTFLGKRVEALVTSLLTGFTFDLYSSHFFGLWIITFFIMSAIFDTIANTFLSRKSRNALFLSITAATLVVFILDISLTSLHSVFVKSEAGFSFSFNQMFSIIIASILTGLVGVLCMIRISSRPNYHIKPYIVQRS